MGTTLTGTVISATYDSLLKVTDNDAITSTAKRITDGLGNDTPLYISSTRVGIGVSPTTTFHVSGNSQIGGNLTVTGDLLVEGSTTTIDTETLSVEDPLIIVGSNNTTSDAVDLGIYGVYDTSGSQNLYAGIFRRAADNKFHIFRDLQSEPTTTVNLSGTGYARASLVLGTLEFESLKDLGESITVTKFVDQADGISNNDNDTTIPTSAAVKDYVDNNSSNTLSQVLVEGNTTGGTSISVSADDDIDFSDSSEARFGSDQDLVIKHNGSQGVITNNTGTLQFVQNTNDGDIKFFCDDGAGGTENYFQIDGGEQRIKVFNEMRFSDNVELRVGTGNDLRIKHNVTNSLIDNYTGDLYLRNFADDKDIIFQSDDGSGDVATYFKLDGSLVNGSTTLGAVAFPDKSKIFMGTDSEFRIYHDGNDSFIQNTTGSLVIEQSSGAIALRPVTGENGVLIVENGAVSLYHDNTKKIETTSTGIDVTGTANIDNLTINGTQGTDGQVLTSTGSGVAWEDAGGTVDGSGTANDVAMWSDSDTLTDAPIAISGNNATFAGDVSLSGSGDKIISAISSNDDATLFLSGAGSGKDTHIVFGGDRDLFISKSSSATAASEGTPVLTLGSNSNASFAGSVGIGTTSPAAPLQVVATGVGSNGTIGIQGANAHVGFKNSSGTFRSWVGHFNATGHGSDADLNIKTGYGTTGNIRFTADGDTTGAQMFLQGSNARVGIGTVSPQAHIHINSGTANTVAMFESTDTATTIKFKDSTGTCQIETRDDFRFATSGGEKVRIENGGNVGIGQTSPDTILHITKAMSSSPTSNIYLDVSGTNTAGGGGSVIFSTSATAGTTTNYNAAIKGVRDAQDNASSELQFFTTHTTDGIAATEKMRITSDGKVGIGTTSPQRELHVELASDHCIISAVSGTSRLAGLVLGDTDDDDKGAIIYDNSSDYLYFNSNGAERMRINSSGNVGIGTTDPGDALEIYGDTKGIIIQNTAETDAGIMMRDSADPGQQASMKYGSGDNDLNFFNGDSTTIRFRIDNTGDAHLARYLRHQGDTNSYIGWGANDDFRIFVGGVQMLRYDEGISGTDYTQMMDDEFRLYANGDFHADGDLVAYSTTVSSDKRLKKDIKPIDNALDIVDKLQGVHFNWKENDEKSIGYIAQDVEKVLPEMVTEKNHFDKGEFKTVNYAAMVSIMGEAIKELRAEVEQLKKQIK